MIDGSESIKPQHGLLLECVWINTKHDTGDYFYISNAYFVRRTGYIIFFSCSKHRYTVVYHRQRYTHDPPSPPPPSVGDWQPGFVLADPMCLLWFFFATGGTPQTNTQSLRPKLNVVDIILTLSLFLDKVSRYIRPKSRCLCLLIYNIQYMSCTCT